MKNFKRVLSIFLVVSTLICAFMISASAESETYTGSYNGYTYVCFARITSKVCKSEMTSESSDNLTVVMNVGYYSAGALKSTTYTATAKRIVVKDAPDSISSFASLRTTYKISGATVQTISLTI